MHRRSLALACLLLLLALPAIAEQYRIEDLGLPGESYAFAINALGQIGANSTVNGTTRGYLWTTGTVRALPGLSGQSSYALALNDASKVVGVSGGHAFVWGTSYSRDLGPGFALSINNSDWIAGRRTVPDLATDYNTLWTPEGRVDIGAGYGIASINAAGAFVSDNRLRLAGAWSEIPAPATDAFPQSVDINNAGQIAYNADRFGWLWNGTTSVSVGELSPGLGSMANAVNDAGAVVGASGDSGVLWTAAGGLVDLNARLLNGAGWRVTHAFDINDAGLIAATAVRDGVQRAVRLVPLRVP